MPGKVRQQTGVVGVVMVAALVLAVSIVGGGEVGVVEAATAPAPAEVVEPSAAPLYVEPAAERVPSLDLEGEFSGAWAWWHQA
jgi:hypothetical protein